LFVVDNHRLAEQDRRIGALITAVGFHDIETYSQEQGWTRFNPAQSEEIHAIRQRRPGLMSSFNASMTRLLYAFVAFSWLSGLAIRRKRSAVSR